MAAEAFIQCRVSNATKRAFRALADRQQLTESVLLKRYIDLVVQAVTDEQPKPKGEHPTRDTRLYVRLRLMDQRLLKERAAARGLASATYVSLLVRSHLHGVAPLPREELKGLQKSLQELAAMRRYLLLLVQAAKGGKLTLPGSNEATALLKMLDGVHARSKSLLAANLKSWNTGDGN